MGAKTALPTCRPPNRDESLAEYMSFARRSRGITLDGLVRATDLSLGTIRKIEEGRTRNPGVFTLLRLWEALGLPVNAIAQLKPSE
ncbi:helix-turn-helix domain-containing protein [Mycolicibacter arupensis]|uniref:XRE family transcriptional regulator n=1 Tax=Mycolicibacter arupensis TaxID=342002 RepID=A0A5C7Y2Z2_9MYCO|nr:helix-turn-helix transcriptional regulator [Mycolicibacter arupensis]TXI55926.1 MAG: XRE family transcriptional regulator [Mycolicibacter arupensis]